MASRVLCRVAGPARPWTCSEYRGPPTRLFAMLARRRDHGDGDGDAAARGPRRPRSRRALLLATTGGVAAGAAALALGDEVKTAYEAVARTGRVVAALALCIYDYRATLEAKAAVDDAAEQARMLAACHERCARRTLRVLEKNGGIFIKLGQHLSAMNYLLPPEWTATFVPLQDRCPVSSFASIEAMFRRDTGHELWHYFSDFAADPVGAASLAQVHLATERASGRRVAVKVQHPDLQAWAPLDLALTRYTFAALKCFFPDYDLEWLASEMDASLPRELDFQEEARNASRMQAHFAALPELPLVVPDVVWARERILVMACEAGCRPDDLDYLDRHAIDRDDVSAALARIFNEMIFGDGAPLHCDPHGGNIAIRKNDARRRRCRHRLLRLLGLRRESNFDVILYDHGLYREIPLPLRRSYAKLWLAVIDGDVVRMRTYAREVAGIGDRDFPLFASAITGRDFGVVCREGSILQARTADEQQTMSGALRDGLIVDLVQMLSRVPPIMLLILKTNDLTRSLDEGLRTRLGPVRSFLILARYCSRTVFHERLDQVRAQGSLLWPPNALRVLAAWLAYLRVEVKLEAFELALAAKRLLGLRTVDFGPAPSSAAATA